MIELLAPVGSYEALVAAVESGADAVYLAGKMFGARASAPNFTDEELADAVRYAHLRGVRVYVTVNTLVDDSEIIVLTEYLRYLYQINADAIIVQDLGVAHIARSVVPGLPLHASTQMTVHSLDGVKMAAELGCKRVVLAREMSLDELEYICANASLEIEVFVHGAICICYSGQCLMSSLIGGRSGNRGRCAQPCRLPFTLVDEADTDLLAECDSGEYLLSPKDLSTLEMVPALIQAGVHSFKIEGRMKRPEYVAIVVGAYRKAIDAHFHVTHEGAVTEQDRKDLAQIFNRDFTTAYLQGRQGRNMMSDRRPNNRGVRIGRVVSYQPTQRMVAIKLDEPVAVGDIIEFWVKVGGRVNTTVRELLVNGHSVEQASAGTEVELAVPGAVKPNDRVFKVFDAKLMEKARGYFTSATAVRRIPLTVTVEVAVGQPLVIELQDADGYCGRAVTAFIAEPALKRPLTAEIIERQIERLGTTIFSLTKFNCHISGEVMVPVSEINEARRQAVIALEEARLARFARPPLVGPTASYLLNHRRMAQSLTDSKAVEVVVNVDTLAKVDMALRNGAHVIIFGGDSYQHQLITLADYQQVVQMVRAAGRKIILNTPRIVKEWQMKAFLAELNLFAALQPDAVSVSTLGTLYQVKQMGGLNIHGDYPLNIYNGASIRALAEYGAESVTLSPELTMSQVEKLANASDIVLECVVQGHLPLMVSEYCTVGSYLGRLDAGACKTACQGRQFWLLDRKEEKFPIITDQYCRMHLLNGKELSMIPFIPKLTRTGINRLRIEGKYMQAERLGMVVRLYREVIEQGEEHAVFRMNQFESIEKGGITRGHYFRGVL